MSESKDIDLETSADIIAIAAKYIVFSVLAVAVGAIGIVYSILAFAIYGKEATSFSIAGGFFVGVAFILIGVFLVFWGLYWMRSEGKRLKKKYGK
ncbi:MAG: hypothetical protein Q6362_003245 [Candidatus Wukongarchaeota archaeon]|nr:hypothetical protein [Candidatus Wukongarchaeota archaeon]